MLQPDSAELLRQLSAVHSRSPHWRHQHRHLLQRMDTVLRVVSIRTHLKVGLEALGQRPPHRTELHGAGQAVHDQHVAVSQLQAGVGHRPFLQQ